MASYIGKVQINSGDYALVGSTLYGICYTAAATAQKDITANTTTPAITGDYVNTSYDNPIRGSTIHIKFVNGNSVTTGASLLVGTLTNAFNVVGNFTCPANTIISFTLDENQNWVVNDNVDTNTEYVFKTPYNASTNKVVGTADIGNYERITAVVSSYSASGSLEWYLSVGDLCTRRYHSLALGSNYRDIERELVACHRSRWELERYAESVLREGLA